mmetsp:Transcript_5436/g.24181  ORF Transcript_5436/g.24181 Transcript_5436/m.24181 type:complete len:440 (+) Transcript_5436:1721-3040(+)
MSRLKVPDEHVPVLVARHQHLPIRRDAPDRPLVLPEPNPPDGSELAPRVQLPDGQVTQLRRHALRLRRRESRRRSRRRGRRRRPAVRQRRRRRRRTPRERVGRLQQTHPRRLRPSRETLRRPRHRRRRATAAPPRGVRAPRRDVHELGGQPPVVPVDAPGEVGRRRPGRGGVRRIVRRIVRRRDSGLIPSGRRSETLRALARYESVRVPRRRFPYAPHVLRLPPPFRRERRPRASQRILREGHHVTLAVVPGGDHPPGPDQHRGDSLGVDPPPAVRARPVPATARRRGHVGLHSRVGARWDHLRSVHLVVQANAVEGAGPVQDAAVVAALDDLSRPHVDARHPGGRGVLPLHRGLARVLSLGGARRTLQLSEAPAGDGVPDANRRVVAAGDQKRRGSNLRRPDPRAGPVRRAGHERHAPHGFRVTHQARQPVAEGPASR